MPRWDEYHCHFAIEQREFAAEMPSCLIPSLRLWVTERRNHRRAQIEVRNQLRARAFPDLDCIADVIGVPVCKQNQIDMIEGGQLLLAARENRVR
jgi:hypothetical protein